jgi:uncharacterized protein (TIGR03083 family)
VILREPDPVKTAHLFAPMRAELVRLLNELPAEAWRYPTACRGWTVKDIVLHLLGDDMGILSRKRDGFVHTDTTPENFEQLIAFVNLQNDIWIRAARRISPELLISLLEVTGMQVNAWVNALDMSEAGDPVQWAGSGPAPRWLEVAREYTEYWVHHQHICDAIGETSLKDRNYMAPVLQTFVRALPRAYSGVGAPLETLVRLDITGEAEDTWYLLRERGGWRLYERANLEPAVSILLADETLWRLFTRGLNRREAESNTAVEGNAALAEPFFSTVAIIA